MTVSEGSEFVVGGTEVIGRLRMEGGELRALAAASLTILVGIESLPTAATAVLKGAISAGEDPVEWIVQDGAADPDLLFEGVLGTAGGFPSRIAKDFAVSTTAGLEEGFFDITWAAPAGLSQAFFRLRPD